jgi:DNA-binding Lrp family transcriptional regulator
MKNLTSVPIEFYDLRKKLTAELLSIGKSSEVYKRSISLGGMADMMGISKETVLNLLESLEQGKDIVIDRQRMLIKIKPE